MKTWWKSPDLGAALIILLTILVYLPAINGGFIWDDDDYVTNNRTLRSTEGLRQIWLDPNVTPQYYPLTFTVFWVEYHLWGLHPFGFHLVNVLLQAVNAILFWRLLLKLGMPGAWWAAAVFALHPVHVMSVAWVTELKNVLSGFFFLAALLSYLRFCGLESDGPVPSANRPRLYALAIGLYLCALLSKTATSILPLAILLILWWKRGRIARKELMPLVPFIVIGVLFGVFTLWLETHAKGASGREFSLTFLERVLVAGRSFWFCLGKLAWPARLMFIYPRWQIDAAAAWQYLFPLGALALLVTLWCTRRWIGRVPFAALVYFTMAFPALVLVQVLYMMRYSFVTDHWQYLGSMSVIPLGVGGTTLALRKCSPALRKQGPVLGAVVLALLGLLTWRQGHIYHDLETLWRDTLAKNPNAWIAHNNLGATLADQGKVANAIAEYREALRINPDIAEAHDNLGTALIRLGKLEEAMQHYEHALQLRPEYAKAHNDLGFALWQTGKTQEAVEHFEQAVRLKSDYAEAQNNLAWALAVLDRAQGGDPARAVTLAERACKLTSHRVSPHLDTLAAAYAAAGRFNDAVATAQKAIELARSAGQPQLVKEMEAHLELYRGGHAYRRSTDVTSPQNR